MALWPFTPQPCTIQNKGSIILYTWIIPHCDFSGRLESPTFSPKGRNEPKFCLILDNNSRSDLQNTCYTLETYLRIDIQLKSQIQCDIKTKFNIWISSGHITNHVISINVMKTENTDTVVFSSIDQRITRIAKIVTLTENTRWGYTSRFVLILCEGIVLEEIKNGQEKGIDRFLSNLGKVVNNEKFSDVTLTVDGKEIPSHKLILAAQSPVFTAMFESDMKESRQSRIEITDIDYEVLMEMLRYMYTGHAPSLDKMAGDLLAAADKYALESLKVMCEQSLIKNISVQNACLILCLADLHSAKHLREATINYITDKSRVMDVLKTAEWKDMTPTHPHIIADVFQAFAAKQLLT